jgi:sulfatase maturation enzyme AslB (radical SAM superfamily)
MRYSATYGFHDYLRPEFPSQIIVDVTEKCNLACAHCPHHLFERSKNYGGRHLDQSLHKKLIDEIASDGKNYCRYIRYTGLGETLLHPKFVEMIEYASKYCEVPLNVTTNGQILTEERAKRLLDAGVDIFDISIDAYSAETYRKIRRKGDLSKVRTNCLRLIKTIHTHKYKTKLIVSFVEQPLNKNESLKFKSFWENCGADFVVIRPLHSASGAVKKIAQKMKEHLSERRPCLYPWERLILNPLGRISYCPAEWKYQACFADFRVTTIKDIWQGDFMRALRKAHLRNDFSNFSFCRQCPDWSLTVWPTQGKNYARMMQEIME